MRTEPSRRRGTPSPSPATRDSVALAVSRLPRGAYSVRYRVVSADRRARDLRRLRLRRRGLAGGVGRRGAERRVGDHGARAGRQVDAARRPGRPAGGRGRGASRGFGGSTGSDLRLAAAGWAAGGARPRPARRRPATDGRLLARRAARHLGGGGADLARRRVCWPPAGPCSSPGARPRSAVGRSRRRPLGALVAIAAHVEAGHAGAGSWPSAVTVTAQVAHFAAVGGLVRGPGGAAARRPGRPLSGQGGRRPPLRRGRPRGAGRRRGHRHPARRGRALLLRRPLLHRLRRRGAGEDRPDRRPSSCSPSATGGAPSRPRPRTSARCAAPPGPSSRSPWSPSRSPPCSGPWRRRSPGRGRLRRPCRTRAATAGDIVEVDLEAASAEPGSQPLRRPGRGLRRR